MKKIAILTDPFMSWNGGVDFVKHLLLGLNSVAKEKKFELYVFVADANSYKKQKGIKRFLFKMREKLFLKLFLKESHPIFEEFKGIKFVEYNTQNFKKILKKLHIDTILPSLSLENLDVPMQSIGYLYDCQHKYFPEFFHENDVKARDEFFSQMVNNAKKLIVNANSVKEDLIKFFNAKPENIFVLPFTPKLKLEYLDDNSEKIKKYNLPDKYFIISNQFWLHKDHPTAFKAFAELIKDQEYQDIQLICTGLMEDGRKPEYIDELKKLIEDLGCKDKIHCLGLIPKMEQIEIMKGSLAVIQPTLFEGGPGGGSVWDAISLGIPAIISDIPTNTEIQEKNIFFYKARDVEDLVLKMKIFLSQQIDYPSKAELIEKSNKNIKKLGDFLSNIINDVCLK